MSRRGAVGGAAALAAALILQVLPAHAARTPKWAREVVDAAPPAPEGVGRHKERVLYDETREKVREDGTVYVVYRHASQVLTSRSRGVGTGWFPFDETMKLRATKAWHIRPGKKTKRSREAPVDVAVGGEFLSDSKMRVVPVDDVEKGSIVLFEFTAVETPYTLPRRHVFASAHPTVVQRYALEVPEGWELQWDWLRHEGEPPRWEGRTAIWELRDRPPPEEEPLGPSMLEQWPALALNLFPPDGEKVKPAVMTSWSDFSAWYEQVTGHRHRVTPAIEAAAGEALEGTDSAVLPVIESAGRYVRDKVRYVAVELGVGAFQPRPASETLSNLYGDCKDKGTLFRSFLSVEEVPSHPVLVNLSEHETLSEKVPAWGFNHYVVAVPLPGGEPVPEAYRHAILDAGDLGRFLIVDTTDEATSVGYISAALSGKRALLVDGERGRLVTLPGMDPEAHRVLRVLSAEVTPTGSMRLVRRSSYFGDYAGWVRRSYAGSATDRRRSVERWMINLWPEARIEDYDAEVESQEGAFVETVTTFVPLGDSGGRGPRISVFPGARSELRRVSLAKRTVPVIYGYPRTIRYQVSLSGLPEGVEAPEEEEASGDGWSASARFALDGGTLEAGWELVLERTRFEPEAFEELRALWSAVRRTSGAALRLPES